MSLIEPVSRQSVSLRQQVTQHLRDAILDGRLMPGQKLVERELCELLDISRTLLREALQQLQAEGLITTVLHKGPSVAIIGADEVGDIYEVRQVLEALAAAAFARNATDEEVRALRQQVEILKAPAMDSARDRLMAKSGFYNVLLQGCGNGVVGQVLTQLTNRIMLFRRLSMGAPGRVEAMLEELDGIVSAIEARDADRAAALCAQHVANARDTVLAQLEKASSQETAS